MKTGKQITQAVSTALDTSRNQTVISESVGSFDRQQIEFSTAKMVDKFKVIWGDQMKLDTQQRYDEFVSLYTETFIDLGMTQEIGNAAYLATRGNTFYPKPLEFYEAGLNKLLERFKSPAEAFAMAFDGLETYRKVPELYESVRRMGGYSYAVQISGSQGFRKNFEAIYKSVCEEIIKGLQIELPEVVQLVEDKHTKAPPEFVEGRVAELMGMLRGV